MATQIRVSLFSFPFYRSEKESGSSGPNGRYLPMKRDETSRSAAGVSPRKLHVNGHEKTVGANRRRREPMPSSKDRDLSNSMLTGRISNRPWVMAIRQQKGKKIRGVIATHRWGIVSRKDGVMDYVLTKTNVE